MSRYEEESAKVAEIQRKAGWDEESIRLYATYQKETYVAQFGDDDLPLGVHLGAGLACDNSRFGVGCGNKD